MVERMKVKGLEGDPTLPADHMLRALDSDEIHDLHNTIKKIGEDFILEQDINGEWMIRIIVGDRKCFVGANQWEVALWKSREGMYKLFQKIYECKTIEEVKDTISHSRLDMSRIVRKDDTSSSVDSPSK